MPICRPPPTPPASSSPQVTGSALRALTGGAVIPERCTRTGGPRWSSPVGGFARLLGLASASRPELEGMHRGAAPFGAVPFTHRDRVDLGACKDEFIRGAGRSFVISQMVEGQRQVLKEALSQADTEMEDIDWFVLPHLGRRRLSATYFTPFGIDAARSTWAWARTVGHLGAGDQFSGLTHLVESGVVEPGQRILMVGVGAGFSWTCAVIEIRDRPSWAVPTRTRASRPVPRKVG